MKKLHKITISLLLLFTFSFVLLGCGTSPEGTVNAFFAKLHEKDLTGAATYLKNFDSSEINFENLAQEDFMNLLLSKVTAEIVTTSTTGDTSIVTTKITAPNLEKLTGSMIVELLPQVLQQALNQDSKQVDFDQMLSDYYSKKLSEENIETITSEVKIHLTKVDGKWKIESSDELLNAISGNLLNALNNFNKILSE